MCNKQRNFYKNNRMNFFFSENSYKTFMILLLGLVLFSSCLESPDPEKNEVIKTDYPNLADDIIERDFDGLWDFINHENEHVRALAWKAIAKSETDDLADFLDYAVQQDDSLAWYALSLNPLSAAQVDSLTKYYSDGIILSESVCEVFFKKGNLNTLTMLLERPQLVQESEPCAKAVGGILSRIQVDEFKQREVFSLAMNSDNPVIWRNLLYGFYRSPINRPAEDSILMNDLTALLDLYGGYFSTGMDEYIVRILGKTGYLKVMDRRSDVSLNQAVQLSNELAKSIPLFESDELDHPSIKRLLHHPNDNVVAQTLLSLREFEVIPDELINIVNREIAPTTRDTEVFVEALELLLKNGVEIKEYEEKMEFLANRNELLKHRMLTLFGKFESTDEYLDQVRREIEDGGIGGLRALQSLAVYYTENIEKPGIHEKVRSITLSALKDGDATVFASLNMFLMNSNLIKEDDYELLYNSYQLFVDSKEWEKAHVMETAFENRFQDRFEPLETPELSFRFPDWDRLYELGTQPFWVLETEKGTIEIQLDPLAAPFTVSSIDSLTRAGAYDNIPFHRVVRNFVVQGGDISLNEEKPNRVDYKLPTEPSYLSFERGMVGIASSGQDTEGSQYFVMLNWSPHLDGSYTIFGKVTKGINIADRIQVGDKVLDAKIYLR